MSDVVRTDDEPALRAALADLTVGQPDLPFDRVAGVRRRHARRRQLQAAAAAGAMAIAALGVVAVSGVFHAARSTPSLNRPVPSWALPWSDHRDGSVPQHVLTSAVTSWADKQRENAPLPVGQAMDMQKAVWYVGQRVQGTDQVLAVFEASGLHAGALPLTHGTRLVVATAAWNDVRNATENGSKAWSFVDVAAPPRNFAGVIGSYIPVNDVNGVHNVIWVLTSSRARSASWSVEVPGPHTTSGTLPLDAGYATVDAGQVVSRVRVTGLATGPEGQSVPADAYLGVPGAPSTQVPTLARPAPLTGVPQGPLTLGESSSQGSSVYQDLSSRAPAGRATTIYARCYAAGPERSIRVAVDRDSARHGVRLPCDGRQHVVPGNPTATDPHATGRQAGHSVLVEAGRLTAWTVAVVISAR